MKVKKKININHLSYQNVTQSVIKRNTYNRNKMYIFSKEDMRNEVTFQWEKMSCLLYFDEK